VVAQKTRQIRVGQRDREIFREHLEAFGLTTYEVLHRLYWPDDTLHAAKSWVRRMKEGSYVGSASLVNPARYFYPTREAIGEFKLESVRQISSPAVLADAYAVLLFCCLAEPPFRKVTAGYLKQKTPELVVDRLDNDHYFIDDSKSERRIGFVYVDMRQRPEQIRRRVKDRIGQRLGVPAWREMIRRSKFTISIVTTHEDSRSRIEEQLTGLHPRVQVQVAVRDYGDVIPTRGRHAPNR
jgi:hypothetical protein